MGDLNFTTAQIEQAIDGRINSFRQAIQDSHTSVDAIAISAGTEVLITNDADISNETSPAYITSRWNATDSKIAMPEIHDHPTFINDISFTFDPTAASAGEITIRTYIDESGTRNFGTDPLIRTYTRKYKAVAEPISLLAGWFFGSGTGYDAKNNGVYFTIEADGAGDLYGIYMSIYHT